MKVKQKVKPPVRPQIRATRRENLPMLFSISLPDSVIVRRWQRVPGEPETQVIWFWEQVWHLIGDSPGPSAARQQQV